MGRHRSRSASPSPSGRDASSKWDGRSGHRLHVSDLAAGTSRREVERAFAKYGSLNEVWVAANPPCFAFINFTHRDDAEKALRELDGKMVGTTRVGVTWARERTFGERSRRGAPYGSYRSGGGNRRRSRSRSRSNSRREKRRNSRSRSSDRNRRRSKSPRDRKRSRRTSKEKNGVVEEQKPENRSQGSPSIVETNTQNRSPIVIDDE